VEARQQEARTAAEEVFTAERELEASRRHAMHLLTLAGNARNHTAQGKRAWLPWSARRSDWRARLARRTMSRRTWASKVGRPSRFESAAEALKRLESEIQAFREALLARRAEENTQRALANQLRSELATVAGRQSSLEAVIRNHSYSTDTVRRLLKPARWGKTWRRWAHWRLH